MILCRLRYTPYEPPRIHELTINQRDELFSPVVVGRGLRQPLLAVWVTIYVDRSPVLCEALSLIARH